MSISNTNHRNCPGCEKIIFYSRKDGLKQAIVEKRLCNSCKFKGNKSYIYGTCGHWTGKHHTDETKKKISDANKGKKFTNEHKKNISKSLLGNSGYWKGKKLSKAHIDKMSKNSPKIWLGKKLSPETKHKIRISKLKRIEKLGIPTGEDKGAKEFFQWINMYYGYNFKPKRFLEIGYDADGYDQEKHIWIEYDTPYHNGTKQKEKDLIRQNNIIKYFEDKNIPLSEFIRVKDDEFESIKLEYVYRRL